MGYSFEELVVFLKRQLLSFIRVLAQDNIGAKTTKFYTVMVYGSYIP